MRHGNTLSITSRVCMRLGTYRRKTKTRREGINQEKRNILSFFKKKEIKKTRYTHGHTHPGTSLGFGASFNSSRITPILATRIYVHIQYTYMYTPCVYIYIFAFQPSARRQDRRHRMFNSRYGRGERSCIERISK